MTIHTERASKYRERAEELRVIAEDWQSDETRLMLQKIALDYERMAAAIERQRGSEPAEAAESAVAVWPKRHAHGSSEYQFRLMDVDGTLLIQYAQYCASDEDALRVPRSLAASRATPFRLEIWDGERCVYQGTPAGWPFAPLKSTH